MNITEIKTTKQTETEKLLNLAEYTKDAEGWNNCIDDLKTLFRDKTQTVRDAIRTAGGYKGIMKVVDHYFQTQFDTVEFVTTSLNELCKMKDADASRIFGDDTGYRYKILSAWNTDYNCFQWPSHFTIAYTIVTDNIDLLRGITC